MSELNEDIDNLFREVIEPAEMQPPPMVWTAVESKLEKTEHLNLKKKYKNLLVYSIASSAFVISLLSVLFYQQYQTKRIITANTIEINKLKSNISDRPEKDNSPTEIQNQTNNTNVGINIISSTKINERVSSTGKNNTEQKSVSSHLTQSLNKISPAVKADGNKKDIPSSLATFNNAGVKSPAQLSANNIVSSVENISEVPIEPIKQNVLNDEFLNNNLPMQELKTGTEQNKTVKQDSFPDMAKKTELPLSSKGVDTAKAITSLLPIEEYKFFAGALYSPEKTTTDLINRNENKPAVQETQNYTYSAGVRFGYKFTNHWSVYSNILYTSTSKSFDFKNTTIVNDDDYGHHDDDDVITNYELATSYGIIDFPTNFKEQDHSHHGGGPHRECDSFILDISAIQKLKYINIPLMCQYQVGKNRLSGIFSVGFSTTILISDLAEITYANSDFKYTATINGLRNLYFSGVIGIGVQYRIFNRFSIFLQPAFSQAFTSINKSTPYKTYPSSVSGSVGLNFHF